MYTRLLNAFVEAEVLCGSSIYDVSYCCSMFSDKRQRNWENKSFLALFSRSTSRSHKRATFAIRCRTKNWISDTNVWIDGGKCFVESFHAAHGSFPRCGMETSARRWKNRRRRCLLSHFLLPLSIIDSLIFYSPSLGWISVQEISFKHFGISITIQFPDRKPLNDDSLNFTPSAPRVWSLSLRADGREKASRM